MLVYVVGRFQIPASFEFLSLVGIYYKKYIIKSGNDNNSNNKSMAIIGAVAAKVLGLNVTQAFLCGVLSRCFLQQWKDIQVWGIGNPKLFGKVGETV